MFTFKKTERTVQLQLCSVFTKNLHAIVPDLFGAFFRLCYVAVVLIIFLLNYLPEWNEYFLPNLLFKCFVSQVYL